MLTKYFYNCFDQSAIKRWDVMFRSLCLLYRYEAGFQRNPSFNRRSETRSEPAPRKPRFDIYKNSTHKSEMHPNQYATCMEFTSAW